MFDWRLVTLVVIPLNWVFDWRVVALVVIPLNWVFDIRLVALKLILLIWGFAWGMVTLVITSLSWGFDRLTSLHSLTFLHTLNHGAMHVRLHSGVDNQSNHSGISRYCIQHTTDKITTREFPTTPVQMPNHPIYVLGFNSLLSGADPRGQTLDREKIFTCTL